MLHAILITGNDIQQALILAKKLTADALVPGPDVLVIEAEASIGIAEIKKLSRFLSRKPMFKNNKIVFLPHSEQLTIPAQNALLKTLEEPPAHSLTQNRLTSLECCQNQLLVLRNLLLQKKQFSLAFILRQITKTIVYLKQNVNPKLALENLFLSYPIDKT